MSRSRRILFMLAGLLVVTGPLFFAPIANASTTFNPNDIIDEGVFNNTASMTASQIDTWLNQFPYSCISPNSGFRAIEPTGYNPTDKFQYGGYVTAGQVISDAANVYGLSPKVLLTTLQKEQSLVMGGASYCDDGNENKYAAAVGYGCPDSGSVYAYTGVNLYQRNGVTHSTVSHTCVNTSAKAGFSQQIIRAAWLLKYGQQHALGNYNWAVITGNWDNSDDIGGYYSGPMTQGTFQRCSSCAAAYYDGWVTIDATATHMDNGATAALYWYTPHFHGNQNFFNIYSSWFGPPTGKDYNYEFAASSSWVNNIEFGQNSTVIIRVRNTGNKTWYSDNYSPKTYPVRLMIQGYQSTDFADLTDGAWLSKGQIKMVESTVAPGDLATFTFRVRAPLYKLASSLPFTLVADGIGPMDYKGMLFNFATAAPSYTYEGSTVSFAPRPNDYFTANISIKNSSQSTWYADGSVPAGNRPTRLINQGYNYVDFADLSDPNWLTSAQIKMLTPTVAPGQTAQFTFRLKSPAAKKIGHVYTMTPVLDGVSGLLPSTIAPRITVDVPQPTVSADLSSIPAQILLTKGQPASVTLTVKNTGNTVWHNESLKSTFSPTRLITYDPYYRLSPLYVADGSWITPAQIAMQEQTVQPGETATFKFSITSDQIGTNSERFAIIIDGGYISATSNIITLNTTTSP